MTFGTEHLYEVPFIVKDREPGTPGERHGQRAAQRQARCLRQRHALRQPCKRACRQDTRMGFCMYGVQSSHAAAKQAAICTHFSKTW